MKIQIFQLLKEHLPIDFDKINQYKNDREVVITVGSIIILSTVFMIYHLFFVSIFIILIPFIYVIWILFHDKKFSINIPLRYFIVVFIILVVIIVNIFSLSFYTQNLKAPYPLTDFLLINKNLAITFFQYLVLMFAYTCFSISVGKRLISTFFSRINKHTNKTERLFLSLILGLSALGTLFFFAGVFEIFNLYFVATLFIISIIIFFKDYLRYSKNISSLLKTHKLHLKDISVYRLIFYVFLMVFAAVTLSSFFRSAILGPDGLRLYLTLEKYISTYHRLHTTEAMVSIPYFTEVLFAPAYMIGKTALVTSVMYSFSLLYLLGFYLIARSETNKHKAVILILPLIAIPAILNMFAMQYKIDPFLCAISSSVFFSSYKFLKTRENHFLYLSSLFMGIAFLVKLTALFFIIPFSLLHTAIVLINKKQKLKVKLVTIVFVAFTFFIPILPWITLYKINVKSHHIGLGLAPIAQSVPPVYSNYSGKAEDKCSITEYEYNMIYSLRDGISKYLIFPFELLRGRNSKPSINLLGLNSIGITITLVVFIWLILHLRSFINLKKDKHKEIMLLVLTGFLSLIFSTLVSPILYWYGLPTYLLLGSLLWILMIEMRSVLSKIIISAIGLYVFIYIILFSLIMAPSNYYPLKSGIEHTYWAKLRVEKENSIFQTHENFYDMGNKLNNESTDPEEKYLFSYSNAMVNINFFIDGYFDKVLYVQSDDNTANEEQFVAFVKDNNIKFFALDKIAIGLEGFDCINRSHEDLSRLFSKYGFIIHDDKTRTLYKLK